MRQTIERGFFTSHGQRRDGSVEAMLSVRRSIERDGMDHEGIDWLHLPPREVEGLTAVAVAARVREWGTVALADRRAQAAYPFKCAEDQKQQGGSEGV